MPKVFDKPGHVMWGFAADEEAQRIISSNQTKFGDRSKTIRALLLLGDQSDQKDHLLALQAELKDTKAKLTAALQEVEALKSKSIVRRRAYYTGRNGRKYDVTHRTNNLQALAEYLSGVGSSIDEVYWEDAVNG